MKLKVQITLDDALMNRADLYADENYISRSGLISLALTQYLNSVEVAKAVKRASFYMQKIADDGSVDDEIMKQIHSAYQILCYAYKQLGFRRIL